MEGSFEFFECPNAGTGKVFQHSPRKWKSEFFLSISAHEKGMAWSAIPLV